MTLGVAEAARRCGRAVDVRLALDWDVHATQVFKCNFPKANVICGPVEAFFPKRTGKRLARNTQALGTMVGRVDFLLGGPPCQGHSDLNNRTRRDDQRNELYLVMARAAEFLRPRVIIIENVPAVAHDIRGVVERTSRYLRRLGYEVRSDIVSLHGLGVPQRRRRHVLIAVVGDTDWLEGVFHHLAAGNCARNLAWAIGDLEGGNNGDPLHIPSKVSRVNTNRINWLHDNAAFDLPDALRPDCHRLRKHSYKSVYGRLRWEAPAQTITTGFSSMGQGRYVHPSLKRTITPREAARLQFFPDFFDFAVVKRRTAWSQMIGNAVPPKLTLEIADQVFSGLD